MVENSLIIGSRGSELALYQTNLVKDTLESTYSHLSVEIKIIKTTGDKLLDVPLAKIGDKGLFTRQIESELLSGEIDLAVHSLKDLQTVQPDGLVIGAVLEREIPNDVFVSSKYNSIDDLPQEASVATGSLRRHSQLLHYRPDLQIIEIRGNLPTRLQKLESEGFDGMILAYAGMHRLGFDDQIRQVIPFKVMLPAVGQGAIAVETRSRDPRVNDLVRGLDHAESRACVTAERSLLRVLEGGCQVPIGAFGRIVPDGLFLEGFVGSLDGSDCLRESTYGSSADAEAIGKRLAESLLEKGAGELLDRVRRDAEESQAEVV